MCVWILASATLSLGYTFSLEQYLETGVLTKFCNIFFAVLYSMNMTQRYWSALQEHLLHYTSTHSFFLSKGRLSDNAQNHRMLSRHQELNLLPQLHIHQL